MENPDFEQLVSRIQAGEQAAMEQLYKLFSRGIRYYLCRQLGPQDLEDKLHDTLIIVVEAIRRGDLREPKRLMGFVRTVVRRQVASYIETAVATRNTTMELDTDDTNIGNATMHRHLYMFNKLADKKHNPEQLVALEERAALIKQVLDSMIPRDREILTRFYLFEQTKEQIQAEMGLTPNQFRLFKSRSKARFGRMARRELSPNELQLMQLRHSITEKKAA